MTRTQQLSLADGSRAAHVIGPHLLWAALVAGLVACGIPLVIGVLGDWSMSRIVAYAAVALVYLGLTQITAIPRLEPLCLNHTAAYLVLMGMLCAVLQSISGDPFVQAIAFTVPFVSAAMWYGPRETTMVGVSYLLLMALGLWISGRAILASLAIPVASYGALMVFMYNSTRMVVRESTARLRADQLAEDLAQERTYLQRLTAINATLARDLDLTPVLEHVVEAGRVLTHAGQVRIWLRASEVDEERTLRLAMQSPRVEQPHATVSDQTLAAPPPFSADPTALMEAIVFPLFAKGREIGVLELREPTGSVFGPTDLALLQPFADAAALAIENAQLYEQAHLSAMLAERNRLARELHDTIAQGLTAITMHLEAAQRSFERDPVRTRQRLGRAHELSRTTLDDVRRSVWTLAAPLVDGASLNTALDELTQGFSTRTGIPATYAHEGPMPRLDHATATQMLRIVQEALQNVEKHAQATRVTVELSTDPEAIRLKVCDDGIGFTLDAPAEHSGTRFDGFGLHSLRERARIAGGRLRIESVPGQGTSVEIHVPTPDGNDEQTRY